MTNDHRGTAFCRANNGWKSIEVPRGYRTDLPDVISYKGSQLMDPRSGWWLPAYNGMAAKTSVFVLQDAYDKYRLWALPPRMLSLIHI